ncbi:hypothetical protein [uncultured Treponema sp.]|uniref:hypothetical protein n=1 Tax=uncultured Treponema sp. TaxID=162155 RepID=UPI0027D9C7A1|nr:hypothetical protein [uncultured Treponema sp.]
MNIALLLDQIDKIFSDEFSKENSSSLKKQDYDLLVDLMSQKEYIDDEVDSATRNIIFDNLKQSIFDYFSSNYDKKFLYRHYVFAILKDQFREIKFKSLDDIDWNIVLLILKKNYSNVYNINKNLEGVLFKINGTLHNSNIGPYKLKTANGHIKFDSEKFKKIAKKIDSLVKELGGKNVLLYLLYFMNEKKYSVKYHRYLLPLYSFQYNQELEIACPFNYLINLSLKHLSIHGKFSSERFKYLISLASDFLLMYELQEFHNVDKIILSMNINTNAIYKRVLFDNIFRFRQVSWNTFPSILKILFEITSEKDFNFSKKHGFSVSDYVDFVKKIYDDPLIENNISTELCCKNFSEKEIKILEFCSTIKNANACYLLPTDFEKITFYSKPFIKEKDKYFFVSKILCGWGLYSVISEINENNKYIDIGNNIEKYIKNKLESLNNSEVFYGSYENSEKTIGECDVVLKDSNYLLFFEIKKKTISLNSLISENHSELLFDLSAMIITSQAQALQHEYSLRKDNLISFKNGKKLTFEGQEIYKISVTLFDLYMLNDHNFVMRLIEFLRIKNFHFLNEDFMTDTEKKTALDERNIAGINKKTEKLNECIKKLEQIGVNHQESSLYSYFLSLEQLDFLINKSRSLDCSLGTLFESMKNVSFSTGCFYTEFDEISKIKNI